MTDSKSTLKLRVFETKTEVRVFVGNLSNKI